AESPGRTHPRYGVHRRGRLSGDRTQRTTAQTGYGNAASVPVPRYRGGESEIWTGPARRDIADGIRGGFADASGTQRLRRTQRRQSIGRRSATRFGGAHFGELAADLSSRRTHVCFGRSGETGSRVFNPESGTRSGPDLRDGSVDEVLHA